MTGQKYTGLFWSDFQPERTVKKMKAPLKKEKKLPRKEKKAKNNEGPFIAVVGTR